MNSNGLQGWFWVGFFLTHKAAICTDIFKDFINFLILSCLIIRITYVPKLQYIFLNFYQFWIRFRSVKSFQNFQHRCKKQKFKSIWTEGPHFLKIRIWHTFFDQYSFIETLTINHLSNVLLILIPYIWLPLFKFIS